MCALAIAFPIQQIQPVQPAGSQQAIIGFMFTVIIL
jgi:hypothetical protein